MFAAKEKEFLGVMDKIFIKEYEGNSFYKYKTKNFTFIILTFPDNTAVLYIDNKIYKEYVSAIFAIAEIDQMVNSDEEKEYRENFKKEPVISDGADEGSKFYKYN